MDERADVGASLSDVQALTARFKALETELSGRSEALEAMMAELAGLQQQFPDTRKLAVSIHSDTKKKKKKKERKKERKRKKEEGKRKEGLK